MTYLGTGYVVWGVGGWGTGHVAFAPRMDRPLSLPPSTDVDRFGSWEASTAVRL